jgi:preflagellin peptidase FlaK
LQEIFAAARVSITLAFLIYASWSDYKTREVTNRLWVFYAPIALALTLSELLLYAPSQLGFFAVCVGLTWGFALLLFYTGAFGGADSKAFMCIALSLPFYPQILLNPVFSEGFSPLSQIIFPITILSNSVLIAAASAIFLLLKNLVQKAKTGTALFEGTLAAESIGKKIVVLITGKKFPVAALKEKWHIYPLEDIDEQELSDTPKRKLLILPREEGRDQIVERLSKATESGKIGAGVWATPGLPMLIFVTLGLIVALLLGDLVWILLSLIMG